MTSKNKITISLDYDVLPGTQINLVVVAPGLDGEELSSNVGFDLTVKPDVAEDLDEEDLDDEEDGDE